VTKKKGEKKIKSPGELANYSVASQKEKRKKMQGRVELGEGGKTDQGKREKECKGGQGKHSGS